MFRDKMCRASWIANVDARHSSVLSCCMPYFSGSFSANGLELVQSDPANFLAVVVGGEEIG